MMSSRQHTSIFLLLNLPFSVESCCIFFMIECHVSNLAHLFWQGMTNIDTQYGLYLLIPFKILIPSDAIQFKMQFSVI